jgi:adenosylhomocysteine nucleosidase
MKVLVTFALDAEFAPWRKLRSFQKLRRDDLDCYSTQIGEAQIKVILTGIGAKKAWVEATKVLWDGDIDVCVSSGLAGALKGEYQPGEVLAAESVYAADWEKTVAGNAALLDLAVSCGAKRVKRFYSADHLVRKSEEKRELGLKADAVEMESAEVLYEASAFGAKGIAVRAISDSADEDLPLDFARVTTESGDLSMTRVMGQVAMNPGAVPSLVRFGQQSRLAAEKLAAFLDRYLETLAAPQKVALAGGVSKA